LQSIISPNSVLKTQASISNWQKIQKRKEENLNFFNLFISLYLSVSYRRKKLGNSYNTALVSESDLDKKVNLNCRMWGIIFVTGIQIDSKKDNQEIDVYLTPAEQNLTPVMPL
jgi:hypothetical protein